MKLSPEVLERYSTEHLSAREAQRNAEFIAWGPVVFQVSRLMVKFGILELLSNQGPQTLESIAQAALLSQYATKCLLEASLSIGLVKIAPETETYTLTKTGWFLLNDPATRANMDFNHDVNYRGWYHLEGALKTGTPEGLKTLGPWPTIYQGLSQLEPEVQKSWFGFDHFYSDSSFPEALKIVFDRHPKTLLDIGGNTGKWAMRCVGYDPDVRVTIADLPPQIAMMKQAVQGYPGADRISSVGIDFLDSKSALETGQSYDALWMSQFLDCFSEQQVVEILKKAATAMNEHSRLYIMETLWDRQRFETAAMCLTLTSLYFTAMANGNSKMFNSDDLIRLITATGLEIEQIHDHLGQAHSIFICKKHTPLK